MTDSLNFVLLNEAKSTNTYLLEHAATLPDMTVVYTWRQTAGRGQKGNRWESEPGMNLAFSLLLKQPHVEVRNQFAISEAASVAICDCLSQFDTGFKVKWPNDIYWRDSKICGILIENSLEGMAIAHSVIGVGININQTRFMSDAPNPVSLKQITGLDHDLDRLLRDVCQSIAATGRDLSGPCPQLHERYMRNLYRNDGATHPWQLPDGATIHAAIHHVAPDGMLTLRHDDGTLHTYAFKQVKHIINDITL